MSLENTKRIARNTFMLYIRMLLTMIISLYTSRVVLNVLGVEDFGIYNVVGGIVVMFSFLNGSMATAIQRFLAFEIGQNNYKRLGEIFSLSVTIHIGIALIVLLLAETVGLWFLNTQMNIPSERMEAARWIYQFSVFSFMLTVIQVPYHAAIIAHERMKIYAYISILEVTLKLLVVFMLTWIAFDKLKLYALLVFFVTLIIAVAYNTYCRWKFKECSYKFFWEKPLCKTLVGFAGWNLFGNIAWICMGQGSNILLNIFFGPMVNAAKAISFQVNMAVSTFVSNFRTAVNPPIVKAFASGNLQYMDKLVFESAKYSYYLLLFLSLPLLLEMDFVLRLWLKVVPEYAVVFCRLALVVSLIQTFDASFGIVFQAVGRIKENQFWSGLIYMLVIPVSYVQLKLFPDMPEGVFYVQLLLSLIVAFVVKVVLLKKMLHISFRSYWQVLLVPVIKVTALSVILPVAVSLWLPHGGWSFICVGGVSVLCIISAVYYAGIGKELRMKINGFVDVKLRKLLSK